MNTRAAATLAGSSGSSVSASLELMPAGSPPSATIASSTSGTVAAVERERLAHAVELGLVAA